MVRSAALVCLLVSPVLAGCAARTTAASSAASTPVAAAIDTEALDRRIAAHLRFLASDALHGRGSGTRDEWIAATYIGAQLAALGLEPLGDDGWFVQEIAVQRYTAKAPPVLTAGERTFTRGEHFLVRAVASGLVGGPLHRFTKDAPVPAGAAVLVPPDTPPAALTDAWRASILMLKATPAQAKNWAESGRAAPKWIASRVLGVPDAPPQSATVVTLEAATYDALAALADGTRVELRTDLAADERTTTWNAVGRLRGADPAAASETVVLSAHLDHIGVTANATTGDDTINNGADDDASGVVAVLELARGLVEGPRPRRSVVFALFGSEEAGGFGARYFVDRPVVPLSDIVADLQVEMIGRPDPKVPGGTLWLTGYDRSNLGAQLAARGARLVADPHPDQRFFERSDNIRFARRGVVAHTVSSFGLHAEYHRPSDEFAHVNVAHMRDAIASLVEPVRWLATTTERPAWVEGRKP